MIKNYIMQGGPRDGHAYKIAVPDDRGPDDQLTFSVEMLDPVSGVAVEIGKYIGKRDDYVLVWTPPVIDPWIATGAMIDELIATGELPEIHDIGTYARVILRKSVFDAQTVHDAVRLAYEATKGAKK